MPNDSAQFALEHLQLRASNEQVHSILQSPRPRRRRIAGECHWGGFGGLSLCKEHKLAFAHVPHISCSCSGRQRKARFTVNVIYGGHEILSDITAAQIALWNAGKRPIRAEDVLTPITIRTDNSIPILEASVRKTSRDLINLAVDQSDISAGSLRITWKILEQNDGGIIQIIYAGPAETRISADGAIVGQPNVHEVKYYGSISSLAEQFVKTARIYRAMGVLMIFVAVLLTAFDAYLVLTRQRKGRLTGTIVELLWNPRLTLLENLVPLIIRIGVPLSYLYSGALLLYKSIIPTAPFEF
jgi:hypothetical protein